MAPLVAVRPVVETSADNVPNNKNKIMFNPKNYQNMGFQIGLSGLSCVKLKPRGHCIEYKPVISGDSLHDKNGCE